MHSGYFKGKTKKYIVIQKRLKACRKKVKVKSFSHVRLFVTPWTVAHQALPSMGFSRQEYWSGLLFPSLNSLIPQSLNSSQIFLRPERPLQIINSHIRAERYLQNTISSQYSERGLYLLFEILLPTSFLLSFLKN